MWPNAVTGPGMSAGSMDMPARVSHSTEKYIRGSKMSSWPQHSPVSNGGERLRHTARITARTDLVRQHNSCTRHVFAQRCLHIALDFGIVEPPRPLRQVQYVKERVEPPEDNLDHSGRQVRTPGAPTNENCVTHRVHGKGTPHDQVLAAGFRIAPTHFREHKPRSHEVRRQGTELERDHRRGRIRQAGHA